MKKSSKAIAVMAPGIIWLASACSAHAPANNAAGGERVGRANGALVSAPSIFLNQAYAGGSVLSRLQARAAAGDPAWNAVLSDCDTFSTGQFFVPQSDDYADSPDVGPGWAGSGYTRALMAFSLCYRVLQPTNPTLADQFAQAGASLLTTMSQAATSSSNDNLCGPLDAGGDYCYGVRFYGVYLSIGLDWLFPAMTADQITTVTNAINTWVGNSATTGFKQYYMNCDGCDSTFEPISNYNAGYLDAETMAAIALGDVGDSADATYYWNDVTTNLWPAYQTALTQRLAGGGWPEGWGYGNLAVRNIAQFLWAASTGKGQPWADQMASANAGTWAQLQYQQYFTWPSLAHIDDEGTFGQPVTPSAALDSLLAMTLEYTGDTAHAAVGRQWAADVASVADDRDPWEAFLYADASLPLASYSTQPQSYYASGPQQVGMRSSWANASNTVWATLVSGPYLDSTWQGEEYEGQGSFALVAGDQAIIPNATGYLNALGDPHDYVYADEHGSNTRVLFNTFFTSSARPGQEGVTPDGAQTHVERYVDTGAFVRARGAQLEQQYVNPSDGSAPVAQFMRDLVYVRPSTFVLYDRTTVANASDDQWVSFHTPSAPVPGTPAVASEARNDVVLNGVTLGSIASVLPANPRIVIPASDGSGNTLDGTPLSRVEVHAPASSSQNDWMNVVTQGSAVPGVVPVQSQTGNMEGVIVLGAPTNQVVLFNRDHLGQATTSAVTYGVAQTASALHVLVDMAASPTGYAVTATVAGGTVDVSVTQGGSCSLGAVGDLSFTVTTTGAVSGCSGVANGGGGSSSGGGATDAGTDAGASCVTADTSNQWLDQPIATQTGTVQTEWDVTPQAAGTDAAVGLANGSPSAWSGLATIVRFNPSNLVDARNGGSYVAVNSYPYSPGTTYHVRMQTNVPAGTYSAWVTAPGGAETQIAADYAFRTEQQGIASINDWTATADAQSLQVCNFSLP